MQLLQNNKEYIIRAFENANLCVSVSDDRYSARAQGENQRKISMDKFAPGNNKQKWIYKIHPNGDDMFESKEYPGYFLDKHLGNRRIEPPDNRIILYPSNSSPAQRFTINTINDESTIHSNCKGGGYLSYSTDLTIICIEEPTKNTKFIFQVC